MSAAVTAAASSNSGSGSGTSGGGGAAAKLISLPPDAAFPAEANLADPRGQTVDAALMAVLLLR